MSLMTVPGCRLAMAYVEKKQEYADGYHYGNYHYHIHLSPFRGWIKTLMTIRNGPKRPKAGRPSAILTGIGNFSKK